MSHGLTPCLRHYYCKSMSSAATFGKLSIARDTIISLSSHQFLLGAITVPFLVFFHSSTLTIHTLYLLCPCSIPTYRERSYHTVCLERLNFFVQILARTVGPILTHTLLLPPSFLHPICNPYISGSVVLPPPDPISS